jgi:pimeloyl-ACP methyl ester carboxylesterase
MILIPGLASSGDVWQSTVEHEQAHFTCYVLDLPGFAGQPALPGSRPMLTTVRDALAGFLRAHHLERAVVVGHSLGGVIALDLARLHPELVGKLVIVDSLPFVAANTDPSATAESMKPMADKIRDAIAHGSSAIFEDRERAMIATMVTDPAKLDLVVGWAMKSDRAAVGEAFAEVLTTDLRPLLGTITAPTLVLETWTGWGVGRDRTVNTYTQQYAELRGAKLVVAETSKHFIMYDDPAFLFAQMDAFLP